jgi:hypothetical protein
MAAEQDEVTARTLLAKEIASLPKPQWPAAMRALGGHGSDLPVENFLWKLFRSERYAPDLRLQAAELLAAADTDRTLDYLYHQFKPK